MLSCLFLLPAFFAFPCSPRFSFLLLKLYPKLPQDELLLKSSLVMRLVTQMDGALLNAHNVAQAELNLSMLALRISILVQQWFSSLLFLLPEIVT